ncbi:MAG: hypothetical protein AB7Q81_24610 [Gammaproteobacteria bacterium]
MEQSIRQAMRACCEPLVGSNRPFCESAGSREDDARVVVDACRAVGDDDAIDDLAEEAADLLRVARVRDQVDQQRAEVVDVRLAEVEVRVGLALHALAFLPQVNEPRFLL